MKVRKWDESIWFSPCHVISKLGEAMASGDKQRIKRIKEAWICAVAMICRDVVEPGPYWIQVPRKDPPDVLAMRLVPTADGRGQHLAETRVEVFEISEHDKESILTSIKRKMEDQDYDGMLLVGFVRRKIPFDHVALSEELKRMSPRVGAINLLVFEESDATVSFLQVYPELAKFSVNFPNQCKTSDQKDFIQMRRGSVKEGEDAETNDVLTIVPE